MKTVVVEYYRLKSPKIFLNGNAIPGKTLLIKHEVAKKEKSLYNTVENDGQIKWFFAKDSEVEFLKQEKESWDLKEIKEKEKMLKDWI